MGILADQSWEKLSRQFQLNLTEFDTICEGCKVSPLSSELELMPLLPLRPMNLIIPAAECPITPFPLQPQIDAKSAPGLPLEFKEKSLSLSPKGDSQKGTRFHRAELELFVIKAFLNF